MVSSCVVVVQGFFSAFVGEIFDVSGSSSYGQVINLSRDERIKMEIGGILFETSVKVSCGSKVKGLERLASISLGIFSIGSILDPIGALILNLAGNVIVDAQTSWAIENVAPSIIERESVFEPLQTGLIT